MGYFTRRIQWWSSRGRKSDEVATQNFPGISSGYLRFLRTQNTAPWRATLATGRRRAGLIRPITVGDLTDRCQVAAVPRGRLVAGCPRMNAVPGYFVPLPTYVNPWPVRDRLPRYPGPDHADRLAGRQPACRCLRSDGMSPPALVTSLRRGPIVIVLLPARCAGCAKSGHTQTARRHAGWCNVWVEVEGGLTRWIARTKFC